MLKWLSGLVDSNEKELKRLQPIVDRINSLEPEFEKLNDAELRAKTDEFKAQLKAGSSLDELLPEAFTAVREAAKRTIGQRHFDVQLMGGVVLHQGKIAEMKTGEGKTLVATLPLYLNSLTGQGCHLVTVNDYLVRRDPYWMGPIYHALGVSVASIYPQQTPDEHQPSRLYDPDHDSGDSRWRHFRPVSRKEAYEADITYGTSSEFGFDYLRDNMVIDLSQCVQRDLNYAIVDEVDNLLIDEARTPLIISGPAEESGQIYQVFARLVPRLRLGADYVVDEKERNVNLTDAGLSNLEGMLRREGLLKSPNLYDPANYALTRYLESALKAQVLFKRDRDYVVKDGQVIIVDEFTGRLMFGRRYSEGLHQAIEAKEHVKVQRETMTFATITIQNYFRMYHKLAGMTGTAVTEAEEFHKIYQLEVVVIPTHKPMIREDFPDQIYKDEKAKFRAVAREIEQLHQESRPVLIGTVTIEKSELLSDLLKRRGIPHQVLNAKYHEQEAGIIARAGEPGSVTVATNMAGRGVDIVLGGSLDGQGEKEWQEKHNKIVELGGLHIIGTERHEARRIDNQLRGRSGRQGDPGSSRFYVSLEDDVVRRFGGDRIKGFMEWVGMDEDTPIENKLVNRSIESAQVRVEGFHFDMRKHLVEYDDVVNKHRELIYSERKKILGGADLKANILSMVKEEIQNIVAACRVFANSIPGLRQEVDYIIDEKMRMVNLTDEGVRHIEEKLEKEGLLKSPELDDPLNHWLNRYLKSALKAHILFQKDRDIEGLISEVATISPLPPTFNAEALSQMKPRQIEDKLIELAEALYEEREKELGADNMRVLERLVMLRIMDNLWVEHLTAMENMRLQAGWQTLRQTRAVDAYKREGYQQFQTLLDTIQHDVVHTIYHVSIVKKGAPEQAPSLMARAAGHGGGSGKQRQRVGGRKIGRNEPCPCGSGKKYKHCCGR